MKSKMTLSFAGYTVQADYIEHQGGWDVYNALLPHIKDTDKKLTQDQLITLTEMLIGESEALDGDFSNEVEGLDLDWAVEQASEMVEQGKTSAEAFILTALLIEAMEK